MLENLNIEHQEEYLKEKERIKWLSKLSESQNSQVVMMAGCVSLTLKYIYEKDF